MSSKKLLIKHYQNVRKLTEELCSPLIIEDYVIQTMDDVSPPKWHLAHTTWFFETFVLKKYLPRYKNYNDTYHYLFNSYYQSVSLPYPRGKRGALARPTVHEVYRYRYYIDHEMLNLIENFSETLLPDIKWLVTLGLNHEQQHQELLMMDIKYNYSLDPSLPLYQKPSAKKEAKKAENLTFKFSPGGIVEIGHHGKNEFCFDNEVPQHQVILKPFSLSNRLITNAEYCEFIDARAYETHSYWLSDGWEYIKKNRIEAPCYWQRIDNKWYLFTLSGMRALEPNEPVSHISFYEAEAFARFSHARLPSEVEWEHMVLHHQITPKAGNFLENKVLHPEPITIDESFCQQLFGDLWEWTSSPYCPYPGYQPERGALGEYNGKFMSNQMVLRGGSCVTPKSHIRATYRNFFQPDKRWFFSGIRLAKDET